MKTVMTQTGSGDGGGGSTATTAPPMGSPVEAEDAALQRRAANQSDLDAIQVLARNDSKLGAPAPGVT